MRQLISPTVLHPFLREGAHHVNVLPYIAFASRSALPMLVVT